MDNMVVIAGPCVVEDEATTMMVAKELARIAEVLDIYPIFKASYRKANRTSGESFTGIGDIDALKIINKAGNEYGLTTLTDIHTPAEAAMAAPYVDILQIPAFLCRQTELIEAVAKTRHPINIKKGQFASVATMQWAVGKVLKHNPYGTIFITERGTTFGYDDLVVDMRNVVEISEFEKEVECIVDLTHSLGRHRGKPRMIEAIGKCAMAAGANGVFMETHPTPLTAQSDAENMLPLENLEEVIRNILRIYKI